TPVGIVVVRGDCDLETCRLYIDRLQEDLNQAPSAGQRVHYQDESIGLPQSTSAHRLSANWSFLDSTSADRFYRIDKAQEHLHYVTEICQDELFILDHEAPPVSSSLRSGLSLLVRDSTGCTALHLAAQHGHTPLVSFILQHGSKLMMDLTERDTGDTALHKAASQQHSEVCRCLLEAGACLNKTNFLGKTPKDCALDVGNSELASMLEKQAVDEAASHEDLETAVAQDQNGVQMPESDSLEFRLLMAYARKKRPGDPLILQDPSKSEPSEVCDKPKKSRRKKIKFSSLLKCIKPQTDDCRTLQREAASFESKKETEKTYPEEGIEEVVDILKEITDSMVTVHQPLDTDCINTGDCVPRVLADSPDSSSLSEEEVVQKVAEMLRVHGDHFNEQIQGSRVLGDALRSVFRYDFFGKLMKAFCRGSNDKVNVAMVCEATTQLSSASFHPMSMVMGFGAKYLQENYSTWVSKNIGTA
ncbi:hypothetical protein DNTS_010269, partial [Danionella cerebrum]